MELASIQVAPVEDIGGRVAVVDDKLDRRSPMVAPVKDADGRTSRGNRSTQRGRRADWGLMKTGDEDSDEPASRR